MAYAAEEKLEVPRLYLEEWEVSEFTEAELLFSGLGIFLGIVGDSLRNALSLGLICAPATARTEGLVSSLAANSSWIIGTDIILRSIIGYRNYSTRTTVERRDAVRTHKIYQQNAKYKVFHSQLNDIHTAIRAGDYTTTDLKFGLIIQQLNQFIEQTNGAIAALNIKITGFGRELATLQRDASLKSTVAGVGAGTVSGVGGWLGGAALASFFVPGLPLVVFGVALVAGTGGMIAGGTVASSLIATPEINNLHTKIEKGKTDVIILTEQKNLLTAMLAAQYFQWAQVAVTQSRYKDLIIDGATIDGAISLFGKALSTYRSLSDDYKSDTILHKIRQYIAISHVLKTEAIKDKVARAISRDQTLIILNEIFIRPDQIEQHHFLQAFQYYYRKQRGFANDSITRYLTEFSGGDRVRAANNVSFVEDSYMQLKLSIAIRILQAKIIKKQWRDRVYDVAYKTTQIEAANALLDTIFTALKLRYNLLCFQSEDEYIARKTLRYAFALGDVEAIEMAAEYILSAIDLRDMAVLEKLSNIIAFDNAGNVIPAKNLLLAKTRAFKIFKTVFERLPDQRPIFDSDRGYPLAVILSDEQKGFLRAASDLGCKYSRAWLALAYLSQPEINEADRDFILATINDPQSCPYADYLAGLIHENGLCGIARNYDEAIEAYKRAQDKVPFASYRHAKILLMQNNGVYQHAIDGLTELERNRKAYLLLTDAITRGVSVAQNINNDYFTTHEIGDTRAHTLGDIRKNLVFSDLIFIAEPQAEAALPVVDVRPAAAPPGGVLRPAVAPDGQNMRALAGALDRTARVLQQVSAALGQLDREGVPLAEGAER